MGFSIINVNRNIKDLKEEGSFLNPSECYKLLMFIFKRLGYSKGGGKNIEEKSIKKS